eukprot:s1055_g17.t1
MWSQTLARWWKELWPGQEERGRSLQQAALAMECELCPSWAVPPAEAPVGEDNAYKVAQILLSDRDGSRIPKIIEEPHRLINWKNVSLRGAE